MVAMGAGQWQAFVSAGTRTGKLATVRADGRPHVAPVWFLLDGDDVVFNTGASSVKGRALARTGVAALCVDDEVAPFAFVTLSGTVRLSEDLDEVRAWATRIAARYMGAAAAPAYGARNGVPGELLVRLTPTSVVAEQGVAV
ncbi:PPOX class F420-dependent oxidoreductase [Frankia sp. R82]|uniref:PPOX class F420-dependent oxidoreductase n=1 Tax=Frankia sp. R82 TaxID=2950553 RepID=UPI0020443608|nr:PPOX class F420-dependent oxidoreductase [Frankia sp. R82]MCM3884569.1 PPOX class F420-dependent oxidoreductase [Frankia sp. R82]